MIHRFQRFGSLTVVALVALATLLVAEIETAHAQVEGNRVEFELTVDDRHDNPDLDGTLRARRTAKIADKAAQRIEKRLDTMGVKNHDVEVDDDRNIEVTAYGDHDESVIKGAIIPSGRLEIRPVLVNESPWIDVSSELPGDVKLRSEPGVFRTDRLYLFAHSAPLLRRTLDEFGPEGVDFEIFPDGDGWRSLRLGPTGATESDVQSADLESNPAGVPYVSLSLSSRAAQSIRSVASAEEVRLLAIVVDGEVVGLHPFSGRSFSETLSIDPPSHLQSVEARDHWAMQVAGRLTTPIPIRLVETQE